MQIVYCIDDCQRCSEGVVDLSILDRVVDVVIVGSDETKAFCIGAIYASRPHNHKVICQTHILGTTKFSTNGKREVKMRISRIRQEQESRIHQTKRYP